MRDTSYRNIEKLQASKMSATLEISISIRLSRQCSKKTIDYTTAAVHGEVIPSHGVFRLYACRTLTTDDVTAQRPASVNIVNRIHRRPAGTALLACLLVIDHRHRRSVSVSRDFESPSVFASFRRRRRRRLAELAGVRTY